ncbi:arabinan endo-1,5-alpha-L-arabinosidase [Lentzea aerocolonigenes]|uniref:Arabinan endo-1,5-alpha-L-arabinosidase n=1 Tax=Lentzea aerocolonigenes TaxID=68170 RepID=A0A0F0H3U1_LENAE|nr:arabinan endo-1,5-alpha-L-arabinosidase [Lentzea aerocolonigenes]KJK48303.1 arabinan endo-1,5-alpha-L-arabinosidase [Lentzea aerocolonigenes]
MSIARITALLLVTALIVAPPADAAAYPNPARVTGDIRVHDPAVVKRPDGSYLLAHTGDDIALKTSTDRVNFRNAGTVFPNGAPWTTTYTNGSRTLWAPDISYRDGLYYLYYSASTFESNRSAIFLATSTSGSSGTWTQLDPATGLRLGGGMTAVAGRNGGAIEAPYIVKHGQYFYQYVSFDLCCKGASSTYRVMVGRSTSVTGPYFDRAGKSMTSGGGTEVLAGHGGIHGPGHQAVLTDTGGDLLVYHYYADNGVSLLGINRLTYDSAGWPQLV